MSEVSYQWYIGEGPAAVELILPWLQNMVPWPAYKVGKTLSALPMPSLKTRGG